MEDFPLSRLKILEDRGCSGHKKAFQDDRRWYHFDPSDSTACTSPTVSVTVILLWEAAAASKSRTVHKMFKPETEALTHETKERSRHQSPKRDRREVSGHLETEATSLPQAMGGDC